MTFWSNCVIEAVKRKLGDWKNIRFIPIIHGLHFHMLWYEIDTKTIKHFTYIDRKPFTTIWFRGIIEVVNPHGLKLVKEYCRKHNLKT